MYVDKLSMFLLLIVMLWHAAGTPIVTTRCCLEGYFEVIADFLINATQIVGNVSKEQWKSAEGISKRLGEQ